MEYKKPVIVVDLELFETKLKKIERLETENVKLSKRISVLERALYNAVYPFCLFEEDMDKSATKICKGAIEQAEKELEEESE